MARKVKRVKQEKTSLKNQEKTLRYIIAVLVALILVALAFAFASIYPALDSSTAFAKCRLTAASCAQNILSGVYSGKAPCAVLCRTACTDQSGNDLMAAVPVTSSTCPETGTGSAIACSYCMTGQTSLITG